MDHRRPGGDCRRPPVGGRCPRRGRSPVVPAVRLGMTALPRIADFPIFRVFQCASSISTRWLALEGTGSPVALWGLLVEVWAKSGSKDTTAQAQLGASREDLDVSRARGARDTQGREDFVSAQRWSARCRRRTEDRCNAFFQGTLVARGQQQGLEGGRGRRCESRGANCRAGRTLLCDVGGIMFVLVGDSEKGHREQGDAGQQGHRSSRISPERLHRGRRLALRNRNRQLEIASATSLRVRS